MFMKLNGYIPVSDTLGGIDTIADTLTNNGAIRTIAAIFIVLTIVLLLGILAGCFFIYKKSIEKNVDSTDHISNMTNKVIEEMLKQLSNQVSNLNQGQQSVKETIKEEVGKVEAEIVNENKKERDLVKLYLDTNMVFKDGSNRVIHTLEAYRVAIYVFHNGNSSSHGLPFFKTSCIYEMFLNKKTHSSRGKGHINMPLHLFFDIIDKLYMDSEYIVSDIDYAIDEEENKAVLEYIGTSSSKSFFMLGIRDIENILCGFSVVEFTHPMDFKDPKVYDKVKDTLEILNGSIRYIVSNNDFKHGHDMVDDSTDEDD